ncbi:hypothetical protein [Comamonas sp.]|uniref:hypothetical protein n=1 Tax=Comamonas sp. TaxID=34028 RepID=UPI00258F5E04|nr:hypothetical protein [Comamonas sp.]
MKLEKLFDRPIAFHRAFVGLGVGVTGALLLSQSIYWSRRCADDGGWFFKNANEWEEETGLTRREQETARKRLKAESLIQEELRGVPATLHFRVDFDAIVKAIQMAECANLDSTKAPNQIRQKRQTGLHKSAKQVATKRANKSVVNEQTNTKTDYNRDYAETTTEIIATGANAPAAAQDSVDPLKAKTEAFKDLCRQTWTSYASAYEARYGTQPVRNEKANRNVVDLVKRLGFEAPEVARFFVELVNEAFVVRRCHAIGDLLVQCESYRTQWAAGIAMTSTAARQADKTAANHSVVPGAASKARQMIAQRRDEQSGGGAHAG